MFSHRTGYTRPPHYDDSGQSCISLSGATLEDFRDPVYCTGRGPFRTLTDWEGNYQVIGRRNVRLHQLDPQAQHVAYAYEQELWGIRHVLERVLEDMQSPHSKQDVKNILYGLSHKERLR